MVYKSSTGGSNGGSVSSINGETGDVTLTSSGGSVQITTPTINTINLEAASGGSGTVTMVSGTNVNGVSFSISNPTTIPNITISLGAITPSSVVTSGNIQGTAVISNGGTNPGVFVIQGTSDGNNYSVELFNNNTDSHFWGISNRSDASNDHALLFFSYDGVSTFNNVVNLKENGNVYLGGNYNEVSGIGSYLDLVGGNATVSGTITASNLSNTNTGDITLSGENFLSLSAQAIIVHSVNLSGTNVTGTLAAARFGTLSGDVISSGSSYSTIVARVNGVTYGASPTANTVPVVTGTNAVTYETVPNAALANSAVTISGHSLSLGGTLNLASSDVGLGNVTNDTQTKAAIVPNTAPSSGQVLAGNAGGTAYAPVSISGDGTLASTGALTVTQTSGTPFGVLATLNAAPASTLTGTTIGSTVVVSSLTKVGTLGSLTVTSTIVGSVSGNAATVTTNANLTGPITSSGNATAIAAQTGTGTTFVMQASPTITTAVLGSSTATTQIPGDNSTKLATTAFVANAVLGQDFKEACKYASTAALPSIVYANGSSGVGATLTGVALAAISLDSSSPSVNDRVLIKNQAITFQNGIYTVTATGSGIAVFVLTRSTDFDQSTDIDTGDTVFVTAGATQSTTTWAYNGGDSPVIGTDPITFVQTAGQGSFTSGNGITITGTSIAIDTSVTVDKTTAQTLTNKTLTSPVLTTPSLGTATATSIAIGGATLGSNALAVTGTASFSSSVSVTQLISGVTTGTPPLVVSSTTQVANLNAATAGNATTATALQTPRAINSVNFDGTAAITIPSAASSLTGTTIGSTVVTSSLTSVGTLGNLIVTNPINGSVTGSSGSATGNAATATALQTARAINGVNFDGTAAITVAAAATSLTGTTLGSTVVTSFLTSFGPSIALGTPASGIATNLSGTALALNAGSAPASTLTGTTIGSTVVVSSLTKVGTLGSLTVTSTIVGSVSGNAATVTALQNARTIGGVSFDGTGNIVPQTIQSVGEGADTTCFPLFISSSGSQSLQPLNNASFSFNALTTTLNTVGINFGGTTLSAYTEGTWTPTFTNLTIVGTATITSTYIKIGKIVNFDIVVASTTTTAATVNSTQFTLPFTSANSSTFTAANGANAASFGVGLIASGGNGFTPTWGATQTVTISGFYKSTT